MLNVLDLFAGIGGFSLGLERTGGFRTVAFCEIDKKAQRVLNKHWPNTPVFDDVSALTKDLIDETVGVSVDVITGGFPCQDISFAGRGAGLAGERSGLWFQFHRLIDEIQPRYALIENVSALRSRGLDAVLGSLDAVGYDAQWHCIPASAIGAPHQRDRIWVVAQRRQVGDTECLGRNPQRNGDAQHDRHQLGAASEHAVDVADAGSARRASWIPAPGHGQEGKPEISDYLGHRLAWWQGSRTWPAEPSVGRVADGVPNRVDRLKQLGNAVVPQIPQLLGEAILDWEKTRAA